MSGDIGRYCPGCGRPRERDASFCSGCGRRLPSEGVEAGRPAPQYEWVRNEVQPALGHEQTERMESRGKLSRFVKDNYAYYVPRFEKMQETGSRASWNWAAALLSPMWFFYRKMYAYGFVVMGVNFALRFLPSGLAFIGSLAVIIVLGLLTNSFYRSHVTNHIEASEHMDAEDRAVYYDRKGGTGVGLMILILVLYVIAATTITVLIYNRLASEIMPDYGYDYMPLFIYNLFG